MLPVFATTSDLVTLTGRSFDADSIGEPRAALLLEAASAAVRAHAKADWDNDPPSDVEVFRLVTLTVAARVWVNPAGSVQETTGPYSITNPSDGGVPGIYLTRSERDQIDEAQRNTATARSPITTLSTTREDQIIGGSSDSYWELSDW